MLGLLLTLSIALGLRWPMPRSVMWYLLAQLAYTNAVWLAKPFWGTSAYRMVYCIFTGLILLASANIVREALSARRHRLRSLACGAVLAITLARIAYFGLPRPVSLDDCIVLAEASLLMLLGLLLGFLAPYQPRKDIPLILSGLWLALAFYDTGWVLHWPAWENINWTVPPFTCTVGFLLLAWRLKSASLGQHSSGTGLASSSRTSIGLR